MNLVVEKSEGLEGTIKIPASKSHTIRGIVIASLAKGISVLENPLYSEDTKAAIEGCRTLGATIHEKRNKLEIAGFDGKPKSYENLEIIINTLNSGTTTNLLAGAAALGNSKFRIIGDESVNKRPVQPLIKSLNDLGAKAYVFGFNGCPPITVKGPLKGGKTTIDAKSSQYLSSLLIACPLAKKDSIITAENVCETPYILMTIKWLRGQNIKFKFTSDYKNYKIDGRQKYHAFEKKIPSDWSSAAFLIAAASTIDNSNIFLKGLDIKDSQGDKTIVDYIKSMDGNIAVEKKGMRIQYSKLKGTVLDLNNTPDLLPIMAVLGCYAEGKTELINVANARLKETDRIKVTCEELSKMGAKIKETENGLVVEKSNLKGANLKGHYDHRVVMALSVAGMFADGETTIDNAEAINVTFPNYIEMMKNLGAKMDYLK